MLLEQCFRGSYFSIQNPVRVFDRWVHSYCLQCCVQLGGKELLVKWSARAERAFSNRPGPLIIEMQLYFSCVVMKRVLFHEQADFETRMVNDHLQIAFRSIEAAICDPEEFARNYPIGRELDSPAAGKMIPAWVGIDFWDGNWEGEFGYEV